MAAPVVVLEGPVKKRGGAVPVMHDRYCVATWEADPQGASAVVLRTFKSRAAYAEAPRKPLEPAQVVKCVGAWDGKGNFHKYPFGFTVETRDKKLLLCAAPTAAAQRQWLELMSVATSPRDDENETDDGDSHTTSSAQRPARVGDALGLEEDEDFGKAAAAAVDRARRFEQERLPHAENDLLSDDDDAYDDDDDDEHDDGAYASDDDDRRRRAVSPLALSPPDDKLLFRVGSTESLTSSLGNKRDEPDDWGLYGDSGHGDGVSRYDVVDGPVLSLDTELLDGAPKAAAPLASDDFLFEQNGPTFGAVVVPASTRSDAGDDFVDPVLQERLARKHKEKQLKRVTKKLESNRDLYAEMAAARLKSMRKDAKTKPRPSVVHRRRGEDDDDEDDDEDDVWSDGETVNGDRYRAVSAAETSRTSKTSTPKARTPHAETSASSRFELEEVDSEDEPFIKRQSLHETALKKSKKSSKTRDQVAADAEPNELQEQEPVETGEASASGGLFGEDDFLFGEASMPVEQAVEHDATTVAPADADEVDEEEARRLRREKRRLRRLQQEQEEAARLEVVERKRQASVTSGPLPDEPVRRSSMDDQWQRATESQKRKDERRRARKEKARLEADAAAAAEEQARLHREEMKRLEEEELKQERRERRERKKNKEKSALEKKAKELKKKEAELLAEAEKLKQSQEALLKADEIKDVARKTKRRDKYTSPTERIQRREKEEQAAHSEAMSTALVVVEPAPVAVSTATMTDTKTAPAAEPPVAVTTPVASAPVATEVTSAAPPASAATVPAAPVSAPVGQTSVAPEATVPAAPQTSPAMQSPVGIPQQGHFAPGYPAATPFAMPMPYAAPYSAVHYTPAGYPAVPYGPGVAMPTPYYPHLGYVGGIAPMSAPAQMQAFAMMQPPSHAATSSAAEEEPFIGPQLPSPKSFHVDHPPAPVPAPVPAPSSHKSPSSVGSLPELPDVAAF